MQKTPETRQQQIIRAKKVKTQFSFAVGLLVVAALHENLEGIFWAVMLLAQNCITSVTNSSCLSCWTKAGLIRT